MKRILTVFAHPSDESYVCSATVAKYVKAGWTADHICATLGDESEAAPADEAAQQKRKELESAAKILGVSEVTFLGYKEGTLHKDPPGELEELLFSKMKEIVPDIVITYDTTGITNSQDNKRICYSTTYAFQKYAGWINDTLKESEQFSEDEAPKLYYACMPQSQVSYLQRKNIFPTESEGSPFVGVDDKFITTVVSTSGAQLVKKKALRTYESLSEEIEPFVSFAGNPFLAQEYFVMRYHGTREVFMGKNDRVSSKL